MGKHTASALPPDEHAIPTDLYLRIFPDPVLRRRCAPVGEVTDGVRDLARRMIEIMRQEEGIGLAAPQVGVPWRLFVCEALPDPDKPQGEAPADPLVCIDPVITPLEDAQLDEEGCLSLPEIRGQVNRPASVRLEATGLEGGRFVREGGGLAARCWQHELDHLDGVLIIDKFGQLDRLRTRSAVRRLEKAHR